MINSVHLYASVRTYAYLCVSILICACNSTTRNTNPITAAPAPIVKHEIAYDNGQQNAGLLSYDATGYTVSPGWVDRYHRMLDSYWKKLPVAMQIEPKRFMNGIEPRGDIFHVTFEVNTRFARLKYIDENGTP